MWYSEDVSIKTLVIYGEMRMLSTGYVMAYINYVYTTHHKKGVTTMDANKVIEYFKAMNQIPRGSGNEKAVSDWLVQFAKDRNLDVLQDEANNVIIRKPATAGYEDRPAVILQGHMDMVCEKAADSTHDFTKDPIEHIMDGEWLHANGTTLGADNGIAVAMSLAVLDSDTIQHSPLECLFTTAEETGMDGALAVKGEHLHGQYLLNIDTEVEGEFIVSCAGGCRVEVDVPAEREACPSAYDAALNLYMEGLLGGHSGIEIHKERANGNQVLARLLLDLRQQFDFQLAFFEGGTKHNAIPRNSHAQIVLKSADVPAVTKALTDAAAQFRQEFTPQDPDISIRIEPTDVPAEVYTIETAQKLIFFLYLAPNGVFGMSHSLDNLVETSNNLAIVKDNGATLSVLISIRSLSEHALTYLTGKITLLAQSLGAKATVAGGYPAWEYSRGSKLEEQAIAVYKQVTGHEPTVTAIHAGLECGLLSAALPNTQMISFGPTITHAHTPQERVSVPSVERMFTYLVALLKELQ